MWNHCILHGGYIVDHCRIYLILSSFVTTTYTSWVLSCQLQGGSRCQEERDQVPGNKHWTVADHRIPHSKVLSIVSLNYWIVPQAASSRSHWHRFFWGTSWSILFKSRCHSTWKVWGKTYRNCWSFGGHWHHHGHSRWPSKREGGRSLQRRWGFFLEGEGQSIYYDSS